MDSSVWVDIKIIGKWDLCLQSQELLVALFAVATEFEAKLLYTCYCLCSDCGCVVSVGTEAGLSEDISTGDWALSWNGGCGVFATGLLTTQGDIGKGWPKREVHKTFIAGYYDDAEWWTLNRVKTHFC